MRVLCFDCFGFHFFVFFIFGNKFVSVSETESWNLPSIVPVFFLFIVAPGKRWPFTTATTAGDAPSRRRGSRRPRHTRLPPAPTAPPGRRAPNASAAAAATAAFSSRPAAVQPRCSVTRATRHVYILVGLGAGDSFGATAGVVAGKSCRQQQQR